MKFIYTWMRQLVLKNRTVGPWAGFERDLLSGNPHAGWVKFTGQRTFQLRKSPYNEPASRHSYILPDDITVADDELVELEVSRKYTQVRALAPGSTEAAEFDEYYVVEGLQRLELRMPRPYLDSGDFLYRISIDWKDADRDHLDRALALQVLSCPESLMGPGGIGSQSFNLSSRQRPLDQLKGTILRSLPREFSRPNPRYDFTFIDSKDDLKRLRRRVMQGQVREASYNYFKMVDPTVVPLPMQIPTVIYNSEYRARAKGIDPDVVEYLLQALMIRPVVSEEAIAEIERSISAVLEEVEPAYAQISVPFDQDAIAKIAMAICRMEYKRNIDETSFSKGKRWFEEMYRQFSDLRLNYIRTGQEARLSPWAQTSYGYGNLTSHDIALLAEINRGVLRQGLDYVSFAGLCHALAGKMTADDVRTSLNNLNLYGHIIGKENGTLFRPVIKQDLVHELVEKRKGKG